MRPREDFIYQTSWVLASVLMLLTTSQGYAKFVPPAPAVVPTNPSTTGLTGLINSYFSAVIGIPVEIIDFSSYGPNSSLIVQQLGPYVAAELGREPINLPAGWLAKVRYAPIATKFRSAPK